MARPFRVTRTTTINAPAARVFERINDFHAWAAWSPWERLDPTMTHEYSGPDAGVGARHEWRGNRKAGEGSMTITGSQPSERVDVDLDFVKPFTSSNKVTFTLSPRGDRTDVEWAMSGEQKGLMALFGYVVPMDKLVGKDFERGLAQLKAVAERSA